MLESKYSLYAALVFLVVFAIWLVAAANPTLTLSSAIAYFNSIVSPVTAYDHQNQAYILWVVFLLAIIISFLAPLIYAMFHIPEQWRGGPLVLFLLLVACVFVIMLGLTMISLGSWGIYGD